MIKRTLYFGNPAFLKLNNEQMVVESSLPVAIMNEEGKEISSNQKLIPVEDTGIVILGHQQITITQALPGRLLANNTVVTPVITPQPFRGAFAIRREQFTKSEIQMPPVRNLWVYDPFRLR